MTRVALITCATPGLYTEFAERLFESAAEHFHPSDDVVMRLLPAVEGWPWATLYRYHVVLQFQKAFEGCDYVFLVDADMLVVDKVGPEILGTGITATLHPGYVTTAPADLPYERDLFSFSHVGEVAESEEATARYYCGGFVGGQTTAFLELARRIRWRLDADWDQPSIVRGRKDWYPCWHDESALNRVLLDKPPAVTLSPSYCFPQDSTWYETFWPEKYEPRIVALDKTSAERGGR